jgi:predicted membrane GTPase involved in stress response
VVLDLFVELNATNEQVDFPVIYASAKDGFAKRNLSDASQDMRPLFEAIVQAVPTPKTASEPFFQMLVSNLDYSDYLGRIALGGIVLHQRLRHDRECSRDQHRHWRSAILWPWAGILDRWSLLRVDTGTFLPMAPSPSRLVSRSLRGAVRK